MFGGKSHVHEMIMAEMAKSLGHIQGKTKPKRVHRHLRQQKPITGINVRNLSWEEYTKRLQHVYGINHIHVDNVKSSYLNEGHRIISSPIPQNAAEFAAFSHELGHYLGRQHPRHVTGRARMGLLNSDEDMLVMAEDEYHAWDWALRYMRRLGVTIDNNVCDMVEDCFGSYTKHIPQDKADAFASKLNNHMPKKLALKGKFIPDTKPVRGAAKDSFFGWPLPATVGEWTVVGVDELVATVPPQDFKKFKQMHKEVPEKDARWNYTELNSSDWRKK